MYWGCLEDTFRTWKPSWLEFPSLDVPAWSPISFLGPCWLQALHLLGWVLSGHAQQFSTVQSTYTEHGSPVLLDALVVEHGLLGSLWKIHLELSLTRESWIKWQLRKNHARICPADYALKDTLCRIMFDLTCHSGTQYCHFISLQQQQLNKYLLHFANAILCMLLISL